MTNPTRPSPVPDQRLPPLLHARLRPSLTGWLAWLCPLLDHGMLAEIAGADYGYRADEHLAVLRDVWATRQVVAATVWAASEVLELIRYSQPEDRTWAPGGQGRRGHQMRLFCCALLVTMADDPTWRQYTEEEVTLRPLVDSAVRLGPAAVAAMLPLLAWRLPSLPPTGDEDRPFLALSLVLLAAAHFRAPADGPLLAEACRWLIDEEAQARALCYPSLITDTWLLGLKFSADGDDLWRELAWKLLIEPATPHPPEAAAALHDIGTRLVLGQPDGATAD